MSQKPLESERREKGFSETSVAPATGNASWSLEAVGVSKVEEQFYEMLLVNPGSTLAELGRDMGLSRRQARRVMAGLEEKGMAGHSPERHQRFFATPPDVAIEALIAKQREALQHVRVAAARLQAKAQTATERTDRDDRVMEIISGRGPQRAIFEKMQNSVQDEMICFDGPPHVIAAVNNSEFDTLARGVSCRCVYDRSVFELPNADDEVRAYVAAGEEARVFSSVPLKLVAADRHFAMLPLNTLHPEGAALLVRPSSLLDALYALFDAIWERATPIFFTTRGTARLSGIESLSDHGQRLVALLASGLNDKKIASQLEISQRTLDRRVRTLLDGLDASTRFQAGWQAAHSLSPRLR